MGLGPAVCCSRDALRTYNSRVAKVEPTTVSEGEEEPPLDPGAIERAYRFHRARRAARERWQRERRWAGFRFWLVLILVLAVTVLLAARVLGEIERVFGL
jgi:anti-sigma-K factor RskA